MGYGMLSHAMVMFQDSFGTEHVDSLQPIAFTEESLVYNREQIMEQGMYANISNNEYYHGFTKVEGSLSMEASPIALGWFLKSAIGLTSTTSDTDKQTHVFKPRSSDFGDRSAGNPMTIELNRDVGSAAVYYDMVGNNLTLNAANGELLTATLDFVGAGFTKKAAGSPTFPDAKMFKWDQFSGSFDGNGIVELQEFSFTMNNNLEARYIMQASSAPYRVKRTDRQMLELSGTMTFETHSYWDAFIAGTNHHVIFNWKTSETPNELTIDIPSLRFLSFEPHPSGAGAVEASFTAACVYHQGSGTAIEITLVNTQEAFI